MRRPPMPIPLVLAMSIALALAACGGAADASPTIADPASPDDAAPMATAEPTEAAGDEEETDAAEPTEGAGDDAVEVVVGASSFSPGQLTVEAGTEVTFNNTSSFPHTITHGSNGRAVDDPAFDRNVGENASVTITFDEPGTYEVTCKIHPTMNMTVVVEG